MARSLPAERLDVATLHDPTAAPGELVVEVSRCGICGTDLHILEGRAYRPTLPFVLGHEAVGTVIESGSDDDAAWVGRRVTMSNFRGDGTCGLCRSGDERLCRHLVSINGVLAAWGGFAERMIVQTSQVVAVPDGLDDDAVAVLVDAGSTAANSMRVASPAPGSHVVVVGGGPLGFLAAELARSAGCRTMVVQRSPVRQEMVARMGHAVVSSIDEVDIEPTLVVDAAGAPDILPWALEALAPHGTYVAAAYGPVEGMDLTPVSRKELQIRGVRSGRKEDLLEIMRMVADGEVRLPPLEHWSLDDINGAILALRSGAVAGKAIIDVRS